MVGVCSKGSVFFQMKIFKIQLELCALGGLYLPHDSTPLIQKYQIFVGIILISSVSFQLLAILFPHSSDNFNNVMVFVSFSILLLIKFLMFHLKRGNLVKILDILSSEEFTLRDDQEWLTEEKILRVYK